MLRKDKVDDAIEMAQINVCNFPMNAWAYASLGDAHLRRGNRTEAIAAFRKAAALK